MASHKPTKVSAPARDICPECGSPRVRPTLKVEGGEYRLCEDCGRVWSAEHTRPEPKHTAQR
jgi:uncharacterized Zn finger protein